MRLANRVIEGITLVAVGLIFLGSTLGYLPWSVTTTVVSLISLWPVLLVTVGLDIIGRGLGTPWLRLVSSAIVLGAVLYGGLVLPATDTTVSVFGFTGIGGGETNSFNFSKPRSGTREAVVNVKGGAGEITMSDGPDAVLVSMSGETPFKNPRLDVSRSSGRADVVASMGSGSVVWPVSGRSTLDIQLSPLVKWDVRFETGASTLEADLRRIPLSAFVLKTGASDSRITLGRIPAGVGEVPVRIESGAAAVTLSIPEGVAARVEAETGLAAVSVPSDVERLEGSGRNYQSPGFASAGRRYRIRVQTGLGAVTIKRY